MNHGQRMAPLCPSVVLASVLVFSGAYRASAQEGQPEDQGEGPTPTVDSGVQIATRLDAILSSMYSIVSYADAGAWQEADESFNGLLDALDVHREPLKAAVPDSAPAVFAEIDALLIDLDGALSAEDLIRIRAINGLVESGLSRLAPIVRSSASGSPAADVALEWRETASRIYGLADASLWRDMRNVAIELIEDVDQRSGIVRAALGVERELDLERISVFALRLRAAALDQSDAEAARAATHFDRALDQLMQGLGLIATPTPRPADQSLARFRGFEVEGALGETVVVPIKAEGVPRIGLGAFAIRALWSPSALALVEVRPGEGSHGLRNEASEGRVDLSLPQAPLGPGGDAIVASLVFEVIGDAIEPRDYLPRDVIDSVQAAVSESVSLVKLGDLPKAASEVSRAHDAFVGGRDVPGSAYQLFAAEGGSESIERRFLAALMLLSMPDPAPSDEVVVALALIQSEFSQAIQRHLERISKEGAIPILIDTVEAKDASGLSMKMRDGVAGQISIVDRQRLESDVPTPGVNAAALEGLELGLVTPPPLDELESTFGREVENTRQAGRSGPQALLIAIGAAAVIAALAAAVMARKGGPAED